MTKKPNGRPWPKGVSGNPKGRPPVGLAVAAMARDQIERHSLLAKLGAIAARKGSQQVKAIELLLSYAYGRPRAELALEHNGAVGQVTVCGQSAADILRERLDALADRLKSSETGPANLQ